MGGQREGGGGVAYFLLQLRRLGGAGVEAGLHRRDPLRAHRNRVLQPPLVLLLELCVSLPRRLQVGAGLRKLLRHLPAASSLLRLQVLQPLGCALQQPDHLRVVVLLLRRERLAMQRLLLLQRLLALLARLLHIVFAQKAKLDELRLAQGVGPAGVPFALRVCPSVRPCWRPRGSR